MSTEDIVTDSETPTDSEPARAGGLSGFIKLLKEGASSSEGAPKAASKPLSTEEEDEILAKFNEVAEDYLSHLKNEQEGQPFTPASGAASGLPELRTRAHDRHGDPVNLLHGPDERQGERAPAPASFREARLAELRARAHGHHREHPQDTTIMDIPVGAIDQLRIENIRQQEDEAAFKSLCESMREKQLQPIVVVADRVLVDRYAVVAGFRRLRAAIAIGRSTIPAVVLPADTPEEELYFFNVSENAQRSKLTSYEMAARAKLMGERFGTPISEYARRTNLSPARVQNLVRYLDKLPPDVVEAWRAGDDLLNDHLLSRLAGMSPEDASAFWHTLKDRHVASISSDRQRPARRSQNRPTATMLSRLWMTTKRKQDIDEKTRELLLAVIEYCSGDAASVPGLFEPRQPCPTPRRSKPARRDQVDDGPEGVGAPLDVALQFPTVDGHIPMLTDDDVDDENGDDGCP